MNTLSSVYRPLLIQVCSKNYPLRWNFNICFQVSDGKLFSTSRYQNNVFSGPPYYRNRLSTYGIYRAKNVMLKKYDGKNNQDRDYCDHKGTKDKMLTIPNVLSGSRIILAPYIGYLITNQNYGAALALFGFAGMTDLVDGFIARRFEGQSSMLGSFLDPLADKILVTCLYLSLSYVNIIPASLTSLVVSRDALLVFAGFYIRYMSVLPPFTLQKYFDVTQPLAQIQPTQISKINTVTQFLLVGTALTASTFDAINPTLLNGFCLVTAGTTFASACSYAFMKDTYKFKDRSYDHQFGKKLTAFIIFILFNLGFVYYMPKKKEK